MKRHQELQERLASFNGISAMVISVLVLLGEWGDWWLMGRIALINAAVIALNMWVTFWLTPRVSTNKAEAVRAVVNISSNLVIGHLADWPEAMWLWLPYVALVNDHLAPRIGIGMVASLSIGMSTLSILDGEPWQHPLFATILAVFCLEVSRLRFQVMRSMLEKSDTDRELVEVQLRQSQKLQAVGRMAAGVAHEINTPVQFVGDSVDYLKDATRSLLTLVDTQRSIIDDAAAGASPGDTRARCLAADQAADLEFLRENAVGACDRALDGVARVADIVRSMKQFAHPAQREMIEAELNDGIRSTLTLAASEYRMVADVVTDLGELPSVRCHPGELNQVLLNLIVNAAHAIEDAHRGSSERGTITVRSRCVGDDIVISIEDTGTSAPHSASLCPCAPSPRTEIEFIQRRRRRTLVRGQR